MPYYISSGQILSDTTLNYEDAYIENGGIASDVTVNSSAGMNVYSGGAAINTLVNSGGSMYIHSGGTATIAFNPWRGYISAASNAIVFEEQRDANIYLGSAFSLVSKCDVLKFAGLSKGMSAIIYEGGVASYTVLQAADMTISSGGTANVTVVNSYGLMTVSSGGFGNETTVNSYGSMAVLAGGVANKTTVNSYGSMAVLAGGVANKTTVNSYGSMMVSSGGTVSNTTLNRGGYLFLSGGAVAKNTIVNSGAQFKVNHGVTAEGITVNACGSVTVFGDGAATEIVENGGYVSVAGRANVTFASNTISGLTLSNASMTVHQNTTASDVKLNNSAVMEIYSGGVANKTMVSSNGSMMLGSGASANETTLDWYGSMAVLAGGVANETTLDYYGSMGISSGGVANKTTVNSSGFMGISSGGIAYETTLNFYGSMSISGNAIASRTTVNSSGYLTVNQGGILADTIVNSGALVTLFSGTIANGITVNTCGSVKVSSGATVTEIVENGGYVSVAGGANVTFASNTISGLTFFGPYESAMTVHSNTIASDVTLRDAVRMEIYSGGIANDINLYQKATMVIYSGAAVSGVTVNRGAGVHITREGVVADAKLNGGYLEISSGGLAKDTTVNFSGSMGLYGGLASNTVLNGGSMYISGGVHCGTLQITSGGFVSGSNGRIDFSLEERTAADDYLINDLSLISTSLSFSISVTEDQEFGVYKLAQGAASFAKSITVQVGNVAVGTVGVMSGYFVYNDVSYKLTRDNGDLTLTIGNQTVGVSGYLGGVSYQSAAISGAKLQSDDKIYVFSSGTADHIAVNYLAYIGASSGGVIRDTVVNSGGSMAVSFYGSAFDTVINSGGSMAVGANGEARRTTVNSGGFMSLSYAARVSEIVENGGYVSVNSKANVTFASNTISGLTLSGASMTLHSNTIASDVRLDSDGKMEIYSGGIANHTELRQGQMYIYAAGTANDTLLTSGSMYLSSGAIANDTLLTYGSMYLSSGAIANDTVVNSFGGMNIDIGVIANRTVVNSRGSIYLNGGSAHQTVLNVGGVMICGGGIATEIVENGGYVSLAASTNVTFASHTISSAILSYGSMTVHSNTIADGTMLNGSAGMCIFSGGIANNTMITSMASVNVSSGGVVNDTLIYSAGMMHVYKNAVANSTVLIGPGSLYVDGSANDTTVNFGGRFELYGSASNTTLNQGNMTVYGGAAAENTVLHSSGTMYLSSGGVHRGALQIENSVVSAYTGAVIDFTVAERTEEDGYLINDLSRISGAPTYTITVSADQEKGTYKLAQGAENFAGTISVGDGSLTYGYIEVNGKTFVYNDTEYLLTQTDGDLILTISEITAYVNSTYSAEASGNYLWGVNAFTTVAAARSAGVEKYKITGGSVSGTTGFDGAETTIDSGAINGMILSGSRVEIASREWADTENTMSLTITGGEFKSNVLGGSAVVSGNAEHLGDLSLTITGGTFAKQVAGGMYHASSNLRDMTVLEGNVNFTISGGTFNGRVYGGNFSYQDDIYASKSTIIGNVNLTIDASEKKIIFQKDVVAGSRWQGVIEGNVNVTVTGSGRNLDLTGYLWGGCSGDHYIGDRTVSQVKGERNLQFAGFTGDFDGNLRMFSALSLTGETAVNFTHDSLNLSEIEDWSFEYGTSMTGVARNDFSGDTLQFDLTGMENDPWEMYSGSIAGFDQASSVILGGQAASWNGAAWASTDYQLAIGEEDTLVLSKLA